MSAQYQFNIGVFAALISTSLLVACSSPVEPTRSTAKPTITPKTSIATLDPKLQACKNQFYAQSQPIVTARLSKNTYPLCFDGFALLYSGVSRTPIWVAEYLTRQRVVSARSLNREDNFHEESRLPTDVKSLLADYSKTGYDRGHLAPNADMANKPSQFDSFSLANIAPQTPENNRKTWVKIEAQTRDLTSKYGSSYVVTGVAYLTPEVKKLNNRVLVPSHFFKAIYFPSQNQAFAFISPNDDSNIIQKISLSELKNRTDVDAFPNLTDTIKTNIMN